MPSDPSRPERAVAAFDLVVLDIAGTTVEEHNAVYRVLREAVAQAGCCPSEGAMHRAMGADKTEAIAALLTERDGSEPSPEETAAVYADFRTRLRQAYLDEPPQALPGAAQALRTLRKAGVRVVLTTGFTRDVTDALLSQVGWSVGADVDDVVCAEEVGAGRPAPYMVFEAMRRTGVHDVRRVLVAGDTVLDLEAGHHAGAGAVVGVLTGAMDAAQLGRSRHTHLLRSVAELPALVLVDRA